MSILGGENEMKSARRISAEVTSDTAVAHPSSIVDWIMTSPDDSRFVTCPDVT